MHVGEHVREGAGHIFCTDQYAPYTQREELVALARTSFRRQIEPRPDKADLVALRISYMHKYTIHTNSMLRDINPVEKL